MKETTNELNFINYNKSDLELEKIRKKIQIDNQNDPTYKMLISYFTEKNIKMDFIDFFEIYQNRKLCLDCKSLNDCKQANHGLRMDYEKNQIVYVVCNFQKEKEQLKKSLNNLVYTTISFEQKLPNIMEDVDIDSNEKFDALNQYNKIKTNDTTQGLYIYGSPGVGKTYFLEALLEDWLSTGKKAAYIKMNEFYNSINKLLYSFDSDDNNTLQKLFLKLKNVDALFIDDLGVEKTDTTFRDNFILRILEARMTNKKVTFFTSNIPVDSLKDHYKQNSGNIPNNLIKGRFVEERIKALAKPIKFEGEKSKRY
ncbi:DnaA ATPase domain-containing protein [Mycoplasma sp. P36-A1]|uniref:DnaA ATPase domain-containing protein n=1 Tax=Mycoplasma sp. P36-A1 TaxID=3252900 RepID=UPI003C2AFBC6